MPITVLTPMTIPSRASSERSRFAASARPAMPATSRIRNGPPIGALVPQRLDRVEARGADGRIRAEEHADQRRHQDAAQDRGHAHRGGERRHGPDEYREQDAA